MASEREKIIRYYKASGNDDIAVRLVDLVEIVLKNRKYKISEFLDPFAFTIAETVAIHYENVRLVADGGYQGAERVKAGFVNTDFLGEVNFGIKAIIVKWDKRFYQLSHRDVLGAIMGLGIKRESFGDIIMIPDGCQLLVDETMSDYILQNLVEIGAAKVSCSEISLSEVAPREERVKEIRTTIASLRLDVVAAAGFGVSRSRMAEEIAAQKVKLNWQDAKNSSQAVKAGDIISMRGRGRVEVTEVLGETKKGRISILLKRFI